MRIALGHGLIRLGLFIRKGCTALAAIFTAIIILVLISALFGESDFPSVFGDPGERTGAWTYTWQVAILIVGLLVGGRILLAGAFAWIGWQILPRDHRDMLVDLDDRVMRAHPERP